MARPRVRTDQTKQALVEAALCILQSDGPASLSARRVADAAGSSTGALYEFFGDKAGLVRVLFSESLTMLDQRQAAVASSSNPERDLIELLAVSRRFAVEHPMLHQLMAGRPFAEFDPSKEDAEAARAIHRRCVASVRRYLEHTGSTVRPRLAAELLVAAHGGLIDAELSGRLGRSRESLSRKYRLGVAVILDGLSSLTEAN